MGSIHPTAIVSSQATLGCDVSIGPYAVIEPGAVVGDRCHLAAHVVVKTGTELGADNVVAEGAVLGGLPQHLKATADVGTLRVGRGNLIRENVTIHRAFRAGECTLVGDENMLMVNVHIAHDCHIEDRTIMANNVMLAGHVTVQERAYLSGAVAVHQFCRIGKLAMVGGQSHVTRDVPPFVTVDGQSSLVVGLNVIGIRRAGLQAADLRQLKEAYRLLYRSGCRWTEVLAQLQERFDSGVTADLVSFVTKPGRGILPERHTRRSLRLADFQQSDTQDDQVHQAS